MQDVQNNPTEADDSITVSEKWSDFAHARLAPGTEGWRFALDHPRVRAYVYETYLDGMDPFSWALQNTLPDRIARALEIGCGGGDLAIALAQTDRFVEIDAVDLSEGAIRLAKTKANNAKINNINFYVENCNAIQIDSNRYDFIYASQALHHIENLENLFSQIENGLTDGGVFFCEDYIGPSRMQYNDRHLELMNRILSALPPHKRRDAWFDDAIKSVIARVPIEDYLRIDPSEAVRAAEIIPVMSRYLDASVSTLGMSLMYEVLLGTVRNFDPDNPMDNALIDLIIAADSMAANAKMIPDCFAVIVGRKKSTAKPLPISSFK